MADLLSIIKKEYSAYCSTLKETSFDKENNLFLCKDTTQIVYDFDAIVKALYPKKQPSSYDALLINNQKVFCIEFKNQKPSKIDNKEIEEKLSNAQDILKSIFQSHNIPIKNYQFIFIVAYKNTHSQWRRGIEKAAIQFNLEQYKGQFFNDIFTNDIDFFTNEYKKYFQKQLICT
jgi:hypothetical protein